MYFFVQKKITKLAFLGYITRSLRLFFSFLYIYGERERVCVCVCITCLFYLGEYMCIQDFFIFCVGVEKRKYVYATEIKYIERDVYLV